MDRNAHRGDTMKSRILSLLFLGLLSTTMFSYSKAKDRDPQTVVTPPAPPPAREDGAEAKKTIIASAIDTDASVNPCEDFYQYACGGWLKSFELPSTKAAYFMKGSSIEEGYQKEMIQLLSTEQAAHSAIGNLFGSCMQREQMTTAALDTIKHLLTMVSLLSDANQLSPVLSQLHRYGVSAFFKIGPGASYANSKLNIAHIGQDPFSLPEKDFYLSTDEEMVQTRKDYLAHIINTLVLGEAAVNAEEAAPLALDILNTETLLAQKAFSESEAWDPENANNPVTYQQIETDYVWNWSDYFKSIGLQNPESQQWNMDSPAYTKFVVGFLTTAHLPAIKNYLKFKILLFSAPNAGGELQKENFNFWRLRLRGQKSPTPMNISCLRSLENLIPDNLAQMFIAHHPEAAEVKKSGIELVDRIKDALLENLNDVTWLEAETKTKVIEKVHKMSSMIGFGENYKTIDLSLVASNVFIDNVVVLNHQNFSLSLKDIGQPVDASKWYMQPYQDNAYYSPENNQIVLPYTNWVAPYYDIHGSDAANLGSIAYMAHELTHGFDSDGSQFDADGNVNGWWTDGERDQFTKLNQCYVDQANNYKVKQGWNLKGEQIIDENIADQGGLKLAYKAYLKQKNKKESKLGSWTPDQQFFIAYAQSWCLKETDQSVFTQINSDVHAPVEFRVNGVVMNSPQFAAAFNCSATAKLNPVDRCQTW